MKDEDIQKIAAEYRSKYGNATNKDLLFYLLKRLDDLDNEVNDTKTQTEKNKLSIKIFYVLLPIGLSIAGLFGKIFGM